MSTGSHREMQAKGQIMSWGAMIRICLCGKEKHISHQLTVQAILVLMIVCYQNRSESVRPALAKSRKRIPTCAQRGACSRTPRVASPSLTTPNGGYGLVTARRGLMIELSQAGGQVVGMVLLH